MSDLIPSYDIEDFKKLSPEQLRQLKCCEIAVKGEYLFTFINPATDYIKMQSEFNGQLSNSVSGKRLEEIVASPVIVDKYPALTKARAAIKAKREAVAV